ncbi:MAG: acyltransferase, partial [Treponema sp.]|nr:acyltransferase [Treponema sp.]
MASKIGFIYNMDIFKRIIYRLNIFVNLKQSIFGIENKLKIGKNVILKNCKLKIRGNENRIIIQDNCRIQDIEIRIFGNKNEIIFNEGIIIVGKDFTGNKTEFVEACNDSRIIIGDKTTIGSGVLFLITEDDKKIVLGNNCMIGYKITFRAGDGHSILDINSQTRINYSKDIIIKDRVWIAAYCIIMKGVHIAEDCVIGTMSLVNRVFEEKNVVIAGNP